MGARTTAKQNVGDSLRMVKDLRARDAEKVRHDVSKINSNLDIIKRDIKTKRY